ncbi:MAG TPA: tetratricopeptide repeat protein [Candidatus Eisenbacteria bacterium]
MCPPTDRSRTRRSPAPCEGALSARAEWLLFAIAVAARLLHLFAVYDTVWFQVPIIDAATYDAAARAIAAGHGHPDRIFWQAPGYSYFLGALHAMTGGSVFAPRIVQTLLGGATAVLTARIGALLFGRGVGLAAGYGAAVYGTLVYFDGQLLTPTLGIPLLLAAVWLALRAERARNDARLWSGAGAMTGLAALVIGNALVLAPLFAWRAGRRWWVVLASTAIAILPVTMRNVARGGEPVLVSSNAGINLYIGNNPRYDETVGVRPDLQWKRLSSEPLQFGIKGPSAGSTYFARRVLRYAAGDPAGFVALQAKKGRLLLGGNEIFRDQAIYPERRESPLLAALLWKIPGAAFPFGLLLPLASIGLAAGARRAPLLTATIAVYALSVLAFFITARYRLPLVPLLLVFGAEGGRWLWKEASAGRRVVALAGAAAVYLVANLGQGPMESVMNADAEFSVGARLIERGDRAAARPHIEAALERNPDYLEAWVNLGALDAGEGRTAEAEAAFRRAVAIDPNQPTALFNLAVLCEKTGRLDEAAALYERLLEVNPGDAGVIARAAALRR